MRKFSEKLKRNVISDKTLASDLSIIHTYIHYVYARAHVCEIRFKFRY